MYPVFRYMDPYSQTVPHQRDPYHYPYQYYPIRAESIPSEMRADSFKHPSPCPLHHINHINGCHHSCSPCYYSYQPPFPSPPQPPYCYGHCPPPYAYSASYLVPPHYSINQAGYDYDKPRYSCCGCLNHTCHPRDNSFPHIQEEQHLTEKVSDRDSSRLITQQESPPNPVIWAPHLSIKSTGDHGASSMSQQPGQSHSSWFPVDMNNLGRFKQDSEGRKEQQGEDKTRWRQYTPFPVFWMPGGGYNEAAEEVKKGAEEMPTKAVENWPWPSNVKIVPLNLIENENQEKQKDDAALVDEEPKDSVQSEASREEKERSKIKIVPVKQLAEEINPKQIQIVNPQIPQGKEADDQTESLTPPVKHKENSDQVKKASEKKQSSPPPPMKPSKLPPVCLRVDPFPKRKTANATTSSRRPPPSLPGLKKTKMNNCEQDEEQGPKKDEESSREEILHVVNERENLSSQGAEDKEEDSGRKENKLVISGRETEEEKRDSKEMKSVDGEMEMEVVNKGHAETHESSQCVDKNKGAGRRDLSETDAATVIQSAYRGFEVRKCQPLKKLQEIVHIREQVDTIRRKIQEIEASSEKLDSKQRVVISETIMNLLLQLDTIQGLDPSVREVRKSVARDLVCLQEKVDMLSSQSTEEEHVLVKHEAERVKAIDGEGDSVSSAVSVSSQKQESMEQIHAMDKRTTEKTKQIEETFSDSAEYAEASHIASPSSIQESASEMEPMNPVDKFGMEDRPFFKKEESNQPPDNELEVDLNLPVGSEAALEQDTDVIPMTEPVSEQIFAQPREKRIDLDDQLLESIEATDSVRGRLEDRIERAKLSSDIEVSETSELATNDESCNQEQSTHALVSTDEGCIKSFGDAVHGGGEQSTPALVSTDEGCIKSFGDAVHGGGVNELSEPEPAQEVNNQQLAEIEEVNGSDATVDQDMGKPLTELYEAQSNHKEDDLVISEMVQPILDAEESLINITQEDELRPEMVALMERKEDDPQVTRMGQTEEDPQEAKLEKKEEDQHNEQDMLQTSLCANASDSIKISEGGDEDNVAHTEGVDVPNFEFINETVDPSIVEKNVVISGDDSTAKTEAMNFAYSKSYLKDEEKRLVEENEKLRVMLERLLDSGREQLGAISNLNNRVKELERKLAHKKRMKIRRNKPVSKLM